MREDSYNNEYVENFRAKIIEELLLHARRAPNVEHVDLPIGSGTGAQDDPVTFKEETTTEEIPTKETKDPAADEGKKEDAIPSKESPISKEASHPPQSCVDEMP